jgi:cbb3-type cytochrome oxidase maturation protein
MESLFFLIPLSILLLLGGIALYFWAVKSGQYDDLEREGENILFDDEPISSEPKTPAPTHLTSASGAESCDDKSQV